MMQTPSGNIFFHNAQGELDLLPLSELEAVERSGRSSWQEYATQPGQWPQETRPFVPLINARPGATEPIGQWHDPLARGGSRWEYDEYCQLVKDSPRAIEEVIQWGALRGRSPQAVQCQLSRISILLVEKKLHWDGRRLTRGKNASPYQWPFGIGNP